MTIHLIKLSVGTESFADLLDFVQLTESSNDTLLSNDRDGSGMTYGWKQIASIQGVRGLVDADAMVTASAMRVA